MLVSKRLSWGQGWGLGWGILAIGTALLGCSRSTKNEEQTAAPSTSAATSSASAQSADAITGNPPEIDATTADLLAAYEKDAKAASTRYRGKRVLLYGPISDTETDEKKGKLLPFPKNPDDPAKDAPRVQCILEKGEDAALASHKKGDKLDALGTLEEEDGKLFLNHCIIETQLKVCQQIKTAMGRGNCEALPNKIGARWSSTADTVELACLSPLGLNAFLKDWESIPKTQRTTTKTSVEKTSCYAIPETVSPKLLVDLTVALGRIRWTNNLPTLAP